MKATEYFEKYKVRFFPPNGDTVHLTTYEEDKATLKDLFTEFSTETTTIVEERKVKRASAFVAVISEQNQKWNALSRLFEKTYGASPLKQNGFKIWWLDAIPDLAKYDPIRKGLEERVS